MAFEFPTVFYEIAAILALAAVVGLAGLWLRQPLIVGFIAAGILAGPDVLGLVQAVEHVELLAEIGIAVLLFLVGLHLDLQLVRTLGAVAVATGLGQIVFTALFGFALCLALGLDPVSSAYVAVALTFSSTIIIVKLLSDKREIDSLHGRIALGFLIVQDIAVVAAMVVLSTLGIGSAVSGAGGGLAFTLMGGLAMLAGIVLFIRYVAEPLLRRLARAPELLVTFALSWAVLLAALGDWLGLGKELGGLIGGVSLASSSYREAMASRLSSLRDFLLLFFFISLGAHIDIGLLGAQLPVAVVLSLFVLVGNPIIVMAIMGAMGYRRRTGFMAGLTVAQISEFSLIFLGVGISLGHVSGEILGLATMVGLVTITLSTYMIIHSHTLFALVEPYLGLFERRSADAEQAFERAESDRRYDVILFGLGRFGREIAKGLRAREWSVLGVDFDPEALHRWRLRGLPGIYGDAGDPELPSNLPLRDAAWVVVTIAPTRTGVTGTDPRLAILHGLRSAGYRGRVALTSHDPLDAKHMMEAGVDRVLMPFGDAAVRAVELLAADGDAADAERAPAGTQGRGRAGRPRQITRETP